MQSWKRSPVGVQNMTASKAFSSVGLILFLKASDVCLHLPSLASVRSNVSRKLVEVQL